ncbi:MAG: TIGR01440 family protein [Clostridia bacterium]|nr:TIGR01440 family protein [Clostridia bacterium]MBQ8925849.1 TIGR01440 family protein [Clostridia bacterium]
MELGEIRTAAASAAAEVLEASRLKPGDLFVVGCSSSEVMGEKIGTHTNTDIAGALYEGIQSVLEPAGIRLAAQCCEHLNRALVVEQETAEVYRLEEVNAIPQPNHAGGAFATVAYERMTHPVVVEDLGAQASAGMDIGATLIGMHIHPVVVPLRISVDHIGEAPLVCARRRPKYVGGARAIYDDSKM